MQTKLGDGNLPAETSAAHSSNCTLKNPSSRNLLTLLLIILLCADVVVGIVAVMIAVATLLDTKLL